MRTEKQEAVAVTTAPKSTLQSGAYQRLAPESTAKLQIGTLLLALQGPVNQRQRKTGYRLFEALLAEYVTARGGML